jgi:uncharacterized protein YndB with AHSA1/START domain
MEPERSERIAATRRVAAPAGHIFRLITDPAVHVRIDGSGMLVEAGTGDVLRAVGDAFEMEMDREPLGDLPLGRYRVRNTVTRIEPDALLEWSVAANGRSPSGHVWGYTLTPVDEGGTDVTSYCDWSGVPERRRGATRWPVVPVESMVASLERLDAIAVPRSHGQGHGDADDRGPA